jgi:hypothetical protein
LGADALREGRGPLSALLEGGVPHGNARGAQVDDGRVDAQVVGARAMQVAHAWKWLAPRVVCA